MALHPRVADSGDAAVRRRKGIRFAIVVTIAYAAIVLIGWALMYFAGERWWPATLLLFSPRWLWAIPLALVLPLTIWLHRKLLWLAIATGLFVLLVIMDLRVPWRTIGAGGARSGKLVVLTCNLHRFQFDSKVLNDFIANNHPDVVALQDIATAKLPRLEGALRYRHWNWELYTASRYPLHVVQTIPLDSIIANDLGGAYWPGGTAVQYRLDLPDGASGFINLHLASPHAGLEMLTQNVSDGIRILRGDSDRRRQQSLMIRDRIRQAGGAFVLAGDFNTPADSPIFRDFWSQFEDAFSVAGLGFGISYSKHRTWVRIDHVLYGGGWRCRSCRVGPDVGSGHHPIVAELER